jgi:hypothetical protein
MSFNASAATARIRRQLKEAEARADEALLSKLDLMASMVRARQSVAVDDGTIGQSAIVRMSRSVQAQIEATNDLFRAHEELRRACHDAGFIPDEKKPRQDLGRRRLAA